jgi:hypothetical protein
MLKAPVPSITEVKLKSVLGWVTGDCLKTGEPYKGLASAAVSPVLYRNV